MTVQAITPMQQETSSQVMCGLPMFIAPTGSVAANGAITLGTALPATYSGGLYLYLPSGAAFSASPAGWYFTVMSSTTVGTIYNITYTSGVPLVATAAQLANNLVVDSGPGAYTGVTSLQAALTVPLIAGNTLGAQGFCRITATFAMTNSVNNKTYSVVMGSTTVFTSTAASQAGNTVDVQMYNQGAQNVNVATANAADPLAPGALQFSTINFIGAPALKVVLTSSTATEYLGLVGLFAEFFYNQ